MISYRWFVCNSSSGLSVHACVCQVQIKVYLLPYMFQATWCVQDVKKCRAELEARVRMKLNRRLAAINSFLQRHSQQCDQIDELRDSNHNEIRTRLRLTRQQITVSVTQIDRNVALRRLAWLIG